MAFTTDIPTIDIIEVSNYVIIIESIWMLDTCAIADTANNIWARFERSSEIILPATQTSWRILACTTFHRATYKKNNKKMNLH